MKPEQVQNLKKLISQNSFTHNKDGVNKVGEIIMSMLSEVDLVWERTSNHTKGDMFFAKSKVWDNSKPAILLSGHLDTVFPENWEMHIDGDKFYAPGGMDMKAGDLVIVEVVKQLHEEGELTNIMLLFTPDEEDGMVHVNEQFKVYKQADYAMVFEEGSDTNGGGVKRNNRVLVTGRKALSFYEVTFEGVGGHHANVRNKNDRHGAVREMARMIIDLENLADYDKGTLVNVGVAHGGTAPNALAEKAMLKVDIRYGDKSEELRVTEDLRKVFEPIDKEIKITTNHFLYYPSFEKTYRNIEFANRVMKLGKNLGLNIKTEFRSSGSEANWISEGNPDCAILDGFGVVGAGDHSSNEYFLMSSFQDSVDLALATIKDIHNNL